MAGGVDALVYGAVDVIVGGEVAAGVAGLHFESQRTDFGDFLVADALAGQFAGQGFQGAHDFEAFAYVFFRQRGHLGAAIGLHLHQPIGREQAEGFPQRRARDLQAIAQRALVQAGAGGQFPFDDHLAQAVGDRGGQGAAVHDLHGGGQASRRGTGRRGIGRRCERG